MGLLVSIFFLFIDVQFVFLFFSSLVPTYSLDNGKDNATYGWVHVTVNKTEGRLCTSFSPESYRVLCRQLGFIDGDEYHGDLQQEMDLPVWVTNYDSCDKDSTILETCRIGKWERGLLTTFSDSSHGGNGTNYTTAPHCYKGAVKAFCYNESGRVLIDTPQAL